MLYFHEEEKKEKNNDIEVTYVNFLNHATWQFSETSYYNNNVFQLK